MINIYHKGMIMKKTLVENFIDWESDVFGCGYGTGEEHTIPALRSFLNLCDGENGMYDFRRIEKELSPAVAWLLINILCKMPADIIEYGSSPRYGWLQENGIKLREFMLAHTADELIDMVCMRDNDYLHCFHDYCNCEGYEEGEFCPNPFWNQRICNKEYYK